MATKLKNLKIRRVALVDKGANQEAFVTLFKRDDAQEVPVAEEPTGGVEETQQPVTEVTPEPEMVAKADLDAVIAKAAELEAVVKAAQERATKAEAELAKAAEEREVAAFAKRAEALPILGPKGGVWLRAIAKALGDDFAAFETCLKGAEAQVEAGPLLTEAGVDADTDAQDFNAVIAAAAAAIQKAEPSLTMEKAYVRALEDPAVRAAYARERGGRN